MERFKTLFLTFLVILSLFLFYKLMFEIPENEDFTVKIDESEIISYKRFYSVNPNRESLGEIPNKNINQLIVESLKDSNLERVGDELISSKLEDKGYFFLLAFDLPVNLLFSCFKEKVPKLPFKSFDRCYFTNGGEILLNTEKGVYKFSSKGSLKIPENSFDKYVEMDENFMPTKIVGVNSYAHVVNPVESYSISDRQHIAMGFLKMEVSEIIEDDSYLFSTDDESVRIFQNGNIHYLSVTPKEQYKSSLHNALITLRTFIKSSPINFSNYRIVNMFESNDNILFYLTDAKLPFYVEDIIPIVVNINSGKVTSFSYNSKFLKEMDSLYTVPESEIYRTSFKEGKDPFLVYTANYFRDDKRAELRTIDTR